MRSGRLVGTSDSSVDVGAASNRKSRAVAGSIEITAGPRISGAAAAEIALVQIIHHIIC